MIEIKNTIFKSAFHFLRFLGLLIIPTIYGFSYIYAFYNPFEKVSEVKVSLITDKGSALGDALGRQLSKENATKMGDIDLTLKMEHIYAQDVDVEEVKHDSYATIELTNLDQIHNAVVTYYKDKTQTSLGASVIKLLTDKITQPAKQGHEILTLNYKKNYLLAFGIDASARMWSSIQFVEKQILSALKDPNYLRTVLTEAGKPSTPQAIAAETLEIEKIIKGLSAFNPIASEAHMGEHAKYGYGLAPFFISVAMWIGGMVMTFAVHRKIYDKTVEAGTRYFAKWLLIISGIIAQATMLMVALYFIGFKDLGIDHWGYLYGGAIISGIIFSSIIQAIRFSIHNRTIGILATIVLLVVQMASGGGLFPIETQSGIYQTINKIVPMGRTVNILRELSFETDWSKVFIDFGYLSLWLFIIPIAILINHYRTVRIYKELNWPMPPKMAYREHVRQQRKGGDE